MYRLSTLHSVTDRQTDRRHHDANSRSYCSSTTGQNVKNLAAGPHQRRIVNKHGKYDAIALVRW